jgi:Ca-activated chloride channel family protein
VTFAHPQFLWLLCLPLAVLFAVCMARGRPLMLPLDGTGAADSHALRVGANIAASLPALLLGLAILLASRPQVTGVPEDERVMDNILFCLDASGSMSSDISGKGRSFDQALEAIRKFTSYREGDSFGLTVFGNEVWHWVPVTRDTSAIAHAAPFLDPRKLPPWFGGTRIAYALLACRDELVKRETGDRLIILLSDGGSMDIAGADGVRCAMDLKSSGVVVHCVHIGGSVPEGMRTIAGLTGGRVFTALDRAALDAVFADIDQMQKSKFRKKAPESIDFHAPFCTAGLALLGVYIACLFGLRYTPW